MYVVDITRDSKNDIIMGNDSMDAKSKTINYIMDYVFANYGIMLDKDVIDQNLDMDRFSLKQFLNDNYSVPINNDLKIQALSTDKDHCLFLKYSDNKDDFPQFFCFHKNDFQKAQALMKYLVNESLLERLQDNLEDYDRLKIIGDRNIMSISYSRFGIRSDIISLYDKDISLNELLNCNCTLNHGGMKI